MSTQILMYGNLVAKFGTIFLLEYEGNFHVYGSKSDTLVERISDASLEYLFR